MIKLVKQKKLIKFFYNYQRKYLPLAIVAGVLLLINVLLTLPMPLVTRYLIDHIIPSGNLGDLNLLCGLLVTAIMLNQGVAYFYRYLIIKYKARVNFDLEQDLYFHIQELPMNYFSKHSSGYILSRIGEVSATEAVMADTFFNILKDLITMIVGAVFMLKYHLTLSLVSFIVLPFFIFSLKFFHKRIKAINKELKEENALYTGTLEKNITAIEKIKSTVNEQKTGQRLMAKLSSLIRLRVKSQLLGTLAGVVAAFFGVISPIVLIWYGSAEIMNGNLTLGTFFAFNSFLGYLYGPAQRLTNIGYTFSQAMAGLERIYELINEAEEDKSGDPAPEIKEIVFENVNFSYNGTEGENVLNNLNLTIKSGERLAIVGESGQGKSTLVKMILKFFHPDTGRLTFSGKDSRRIAVKDLRRKIAYISQNQRILEEELEEKLSRGETRALLKKFRLDKSIANGEVRQTEFSGGEIQKLELMESALRQADVLIVDEGTSNIDYNSEKIVLKELLDKYKDKIFIFIAHRLSSITDFDRIIVIDRGSVAEEGTHDQLIRKESKYRFLWGRGKD